MTDLAQAAADYAAGRHAEAEIAARAVLGAAPADLPARHLLAACRIAQGAVEEGAAELAAVLAAQPALDAVRLQLAGIRARQGRHAAVVALLEGRPELEAAYRPLAAAHWELGERDRAIAVWRALLARRPEDAAVLRALGDALRLHGQTEEAVAVLRRAVARGAGPAARIGLAEALAGGGAADAEAAAQAHAALAEGVADVVGRMRLGVALYRAGDFAAAARLLAAIDPDTADPVMVLDHLGASRTQLGDFDGAEAAYAALSARRPALPEPRLYRAMLQLVRGDFAAGWRGYEYRRPQIAQMPGWDPAQAPWIAPARLDGQTVRVVLEQGHGDTIQFVRYLPLLAARGARVELAMPVHAGLRPLLETMPGIDAIVPLADSEPAADVVVPLLSLPLAFGTDAGSIPAEVPYLKVPPGREAAAAARMGPRPRVGIAWAGSPGHRNDRSRSIPLDLFGRLLDRPGVSFHVLAPGVADPSALAGRAVVHDGIGDFGDTAALIAAMDLVITVDTAVAHLAGALGRRVWVLVAHSPDWRWLLGREDSPWYPTARLFRQSQPGDWDGVIARVQGALDAEFRRLGFS